MNILYTFFAIGFIAIPVRYFFVGEIERSAVIATLLFLIFAVLLNLFIYKQYRKDKHYVPAQNHDSLSVRLFDRVTTNTRPLYFNGQQIGSFHRFYKKRLHQFIETIVKNQGAWHLQLQFAFDHNQTITIKERKKGKTLQWEILENNQPVGLIRLEKAFSSLKHTRNQIYVNYHARTYVFETALIGQDLQIKDGHQRIGKGSHQKSYTYQLELNRDLATEYSYILFAAYIAFHFIHSK